MIFSIKKLVVKYPPDCWRTLFLGQLKKKIFI